MLITIGFDEQELEKLRSIEDVLAVSGSALEMRLGEFITAPPDDEYKKVEGSKIVIMHDISKEKIGATMRAVRSAVDGHVIFATSTPTSLNWSIKKLIAELEAEDEYFRKR